MVVNHKMTGVNNFRKYQTDNKQIFVSENMLNPVMFYRKVKKY